MTAALTGGPDEESVSELVGAIERGKPDQVAALLAKGASAAAADRQGWTPLHFAARGTSAAIVRLLLQHGADPEARDRFGTTPRMVAEAPGLFKWHPPRRAWSDSVPDVQAALGMTLGRPRERDAFGQTVDDLQRHENRHWQSWHDHQRFLFGWTRDQWRWRALPLALLAGMFVEGFRRWCLSD